MKKSRQSGWLNYCSWLGVVVVSVLYGGCATQLQTKVPSFEEARQQALKEAPFIQKPVEERQGLKCDDKPVVVKKNPEAGIPNTGLLITNQKAECLVARSAERDRLRKELSSARLNARVKQIVNDATYRKIAENSKQSWWDKHSWKVLSPILLVVGSAITITIMYALTGGRPITTNSQVHIIR